MSALIWCPFPDRSAAREVANALLDEKLIACANLLPDVESIFEWGGARESGKEIGVLFKTDAALLDRAAWRLAALHPYDAPAIMGWKCDAASTATQAWLGSLRERED